VAPARVIYESMTRFSYGGSESRRPARTIGGQQGRSFYVWERAVCYATAFLHCDARYHLRRHAPESCCRSQRASVSSSSVVRSRIRAENVIDTLEHAQTRTSAIDVVGPQRFIGRAEDESIRPASRE